MWQVLAAMKRSLGISSQYKKKSSRVADESSVGPALVLDQAGRDRTAGSTLSVLLAVVRASMVVASCFVPNGTVEDVWAPRSAEMDHLMVRDSMRYAIYV